MTIANGYQWFLSSSHYTHDWLKTASCKKEELLQALNGHISLASSLFAKKDFQIEGNMTVADWQKRYKEKRIQMVMIQIYASHYVKMYHKGLDRMNICACNISI